MDDLEAVDQYNIILFLLRIIKKIQILIKIAIIIFTTYSLEQLNKYNS